MSKKIYSIKDLRKGKVVLKNDGSLEDLKKVLRKAFPVDKVDMETGEAVYYYAGKGGYWGIHHMMLNDDNVQSVKDFLKPKKKKVKTGGMKYYYKENSLDEMSKKELIKVIKRVIDFDHTAIEVNFDSKTKRLIDIF